MAIQSVDWLENSGLPRLLDDVGGTKTLRQVTVGYHCLLIYQSFIHGNPHNYLQSSTVAFKGGDLLLANLTILSPHFPIINLALRATTPPSPWHQDNADGVTIASYG
ncbi:MAG: hypothetical protein ABL902_00245 [Gallionella sp.]|nr:hypothetical protein [Gallionella sp.]